MFFYSSLALLSPVLLGYYIVDSGDVPNFAIVGLSRIAPHGMTEPLKLLLQSWNFTKDEIDVLTTMGLWYIYE